MASSSTDKAATGESKRPFGLRRIFGRKKEKGSGGEARVEVLNVSTAGGAQHSKAPVFSQGHNTGRIAEPTTQEFLLSDTSRDTSSGRIVIDDPVPANQTKENVPTIAEEVLRPIREVWDEAYEDLKAEDEDLMTKYEARLAESVAGTLAAATGRVSKEVLMKTVVDQKLQQYKENAWKVKALGEQFLVKDVAKPLVGTIKWADKYIGDALASNPMASIGWAGVMVFLPLLLNPSAQDKALLEGLASVSEILVRSTMQENLYFRRWEANADKNDKATFAPSHKAYRDTLRALYVQVLKYQATSVRYFTKNGALRVLADIVKWHAWEDMLKDIRKQDEVMCRTYNLLSDVKIEEEYEKWEKRNGEKVEISKSGFSDVAALRKAIEEQQRDHKRTELLKWLSSVDPSLNYNNARSKHQNGGQGTCDWLISNEDFEAWKWAPNSLMWLNGKAGSGKSVLSSSVISHLQEIQHGDPEVSLAFFYFSFNDEKKQTAIGMTESIIKQICCCRPDTPPSMSILGDLKAKGHRPDLKTLRRTLSDTIRGFSSVFVVIDALDECPDMDDGRKILLSHLSEIHQSMPHNLHMLWTSRREPDIETAFLSSQVESEKWDVNLSHLKSAMDHDIGMFIDTTLSSSNYNSWPDTLKQDARARLIERSDGMFQYVSCQFEALGRLRRPNDIREALNQLPEGLDATYDRMLQGIDPEEQKHAARVLEWLSFSLRPLLLEEIAEVFILDADAPVPFDEDNRLLTPRMVLECLRGLVTEVPRRTDWYDEDYRAKRGDDVIEIRLAHFSIKEYLVSERMSASMSTTFSINEPDGHLHITESCLAYHIHLSKTILVTQELRRVYQLWEYVVWYWPWHLDLVSSGKHTSSITEGALKACQQGSRAFLNMVRFRSPNGWGATADELPPPLYYACAINASTLAKIITETGDGSTIDETSPQAESGFALQAAAYNGNELLIELLLSHGAGVNTQGGNFGNALQAAVWIGHERIVRLLLDRGTDVNARGKFGNALQAAVRIGHERIVRLLLDRGADVNAQGGAYGNALQAAAAEGYERNVQLLLDRGADVNAQGGAYGNALQAAAAEGYERNVQLLLDRGADVNTQGGTFGNALQAAACKGNQRNVQLLLDRGADVNAQGGYYGNALQAAAAEGHERNVQLLLEKGADIIAKGGLYGNAVQAAVANGKWKAGELLLSQGAEVDPPGWDWEELLAHVADDPGPGVKSVNRLRKFQENPTVEGLHEMWKEEEEKKKVGGKREKAGGQKHKDWDFETTSLIQKALMNSGTKILILKPTQTRFTVT